MEEKVEYFNEEGKQNTADVIELVKERLDKNNDINYVVIASATGSSALLLSEAIGDMDVKIINVTHHAGFKSPNKLDISEDMLEKLNEKTSEENMITNKDDVNIPIANISKQDSKKSSDEILHKKSNNSNSK